MTRIRRVLAVLAMAGGLIGAILGGCVGSESTSGGPDAASESSTVDGPGGNESSASEGGGSLDAADAGAMDASVESSADAGEAGTVYSSLSLGSNWEFFPLNDPTNFGASANVFEGAAFDGRYVYLAPSNGTGLGTTTQVLRYDTQGLFRMVGSWRAYDLTNLGISPATGYTNAVYDGTVVYLVPYQGANAADFVRIDPKLEFTDGGGLSYFNSKTAVAAAASGFLGGAFDGRYLYAAPYSNTLVARYDTQQMFGVAGSWKTFDLSTTTPNTRFDHAIFDGKFLYLVPEEHASDLSPAGMVARYDTTQTDLTASWVAYDLAANIAGAPAGFAGAVFDGQYIYFVPYRSTTAVVARYDTTKTFNTTGAWTTFAITTVPGATGQHGYSGGQFDGRYVYFVPYGGGIVVRYDTQGQGFGTLGSWEAYNLASANGNASQFSGSAFDGQYVYFVPSGNGVIARFNAKSPPSIPSPTPSFY
jgi:hypothetical protein